MSDETLRHSIKVAATLPVHDPDMGSRGDWRFSSDRNTTAYGKATIKHADRSVPGWVSFETGEYTETSGYGMLQVFEEGSKQEDSFTLRISDDEFQTLAAFRLSARETTLKINIVAASPRAFDELDLARHYYVQIYSLTYSDQTRPTE